MKGRVTGDVTAAYPSDKALDTCAIKRGRLEAWLGRFCTSIPFRLKWNYYVTLSKAHLLRFTLLTSLSWSQRVCV